MAISCKSFKAFSVSFFSIDLPVGALLKRKTAEISTKDLASSKISRVSEVPHTAYCEASIGIINIPCSAESIADLNVALFLPPQSIITISKLLNCFMSLQIVFVVCDTQTISFFALKALNDTDDPCGSASIIKTFFPEFA